MKQKAVLVFADPTGLDLARRRLPRSLRPLLSLRRLRAKSIEADFHLFTSAKIADPAGVQSHRQRGATFAERLEAAIEEISCLGYEEVVMVGSDCPNLSPADIDQAFRELGGNRLVLGPDHRGGCYLIALRAADRHLLREIQWNHDRDCAQLSARVAPGEVAFLPVKQDLDTWADLRLLVRDGHRLAALIIALLPTWKSDRGYFVDLTAQHARVMAQRPPPAWDK